MSDELFYALMAGALAVMLLCDAHERRRVRAELDALDAETRRIRSLLADEGRL